MLQNLLVTIRNTMMCLINDDHIKIGIGKLCQPLWSLHRLYGSYCDPEPAPQTGLLRFLRCTAQIGTFLDLICCLFQQFPAVRQDQHAFPLAHTLFRHLCKYDGFSAPSRKDQERF